MDYKIKLEVFEGPFDLLFHLIEKEEVDIYDIPIAKIADQYIEYIHSLQSLDLEVGGEFLVMAATLLQIKSRMLLPKPPKLDEVAEDEVDPRDELVARLLEYKQFKVAAGLLKERAQAQELTFARQVNIEEYIEAFAEKNPLKGLTLTDLLGALDDVLRRVAEDAFVTEIPREEVTVRDRMKEIVRRIVLAKGGIAFTELFKGSRTRIAVVVTFMALLELIRVARVFVRQSENFGEMYVYRFGEDQVEGVDKVKGVQETEVNDSCAV